MPTQISLLPEPEEKKARPARKPLPTHLPRKETIIRPDARAGVELPVSTLAGWVGAACVWLMPLAELLRTELLSRPVLHADETPLQILNTKKGGKVQNGYLWAYASGEATGDSVVCFDCQPGGRHVIRKRGCRAGAGLW